MRSRLSRFIASNQYEALYCLSVGAVGVGVGAFDWRLGLIAAGLVVLASLAVLLRLGD